MSRTLPAGQDALVAAANRAHHQRVWVEDSGGALVDLSDYLLPGTLHEQSIDDPIDKLTLHFDRSLGAASLSPLMTAAKPIDLGREVVWEVAVTTQGGTPAAGDWLELFRGTVYDVDPTRNDMLVACYDQALKLKELEALPGQTYAAGAELEAVIQSVLADASTGVTLDVPSSPDAQLNQDFDQQIEPVLQAAVTLAESIGWKVRYWWHEAGGEFRFSLLEPPRGKTVADWTTGPDRYLTVDELRISKQDIRNRITVNYGPPDAEGVQASVTVQDDDSILKYGLLPMTFIEGSESPIQNLAQATAFANTALSDLSEPDATHVVTDFDLPQIQLWDLIEFAANDVHYNAAQSLAVQRIVRSYPAPGVARISLFCRGKPSAGVGAWKRRERHGRFTQATAPPDVSDYGFTHFDEVPSPDPRFRRWEYEAGPYVDSIWAAIHTYEIDPVTGTPETELEEDIKGRVREGWPLSGHFDLPKPAADHVTLLRSEPRLANLGVYPGAVVEIRWLYPVPPKIDGWIDARYVGGALSVYAGADPTASALPIAWAVYEDDEDGDLLASGSFTTLAAAQAGVGPATHAGLSGRSPLANGKRTWWARFEDVAGNVEWHSDSVEDPHRPRIRKIRQVVGATSLTTDLYATIESPLGRDVTLRAWTNQAGTDNANPEDIPSEIAQPFDPPGPDSAEVGPEHLALNEIPVWPGRGKKVYLEAVDELGFSSGVIDYTLMSWLDLIGSDGQLIADAITQPAQFASSFRPFRRENTLPGSGNYLGDRVFALDDGLGYEWDGVAWEVVTGAAGTYGFFPVVIANSITAQEVAAGEIFARHLNVADVFLEGIGWSADDPGAGSIAWTAGTVVHEGNRYTITAGNTADEIVWWDRTNPTVLQAAADNAALEAAGYDQTDGDAILALNDDGDPIVVWNGTQIYGGQVKLNTLRAAHLISTLNLEVGQVIRSTSYDPGVEGWSVNADGTAEFLDVFIRGTIESDNYVAGTSGWHVDDDGSAEFNDILARGTLELTDDTEFVRFFFGGTEIGYIRPTEISSLGGGTETAVEILGWNDLTSAFQARLAVFGVRVEIQDASLWVENNITGRDLILDSVNASDLGGGTGRRTARIPDTDPSTGQTVLSLRYRDTAGTLGFGVVTVDVNGFLKI